MEPEIARRCSGCGASVRGAAHFCPQCGRPMEDDAAASGRTPQSRRQERPLRPLIEEAERAAASISGKLSPPDGESLSEASADAASADGGMRAENIAADIAAANAPAAQAQRQPARGRVRQRAAAAGERASETLRPRVEKLREASVVVFDEAADDPGRRFLLVAGLLFALFLVLWVVSYILG